MLTFSSFDWLLISAKHVNSAVAPQKRQRPWLRVLFKGVPFTFVFSLSLISGSFRFSLRVQALISPIRVSDVAKKLSCSRNCSPRISQYCFKSKRCGTAILSSPAFRIVLLKLHSLSDPGRKGISWCGSL